MSQIWTNRGSFSKVSYKSEADLEKAIEKVKHHLFGNNRIYLDVKKKIGVKGGIRNIPDGYLIDLVGEEPRLFVVENELASHDPLRHIAVQILQFSLSFESDKIAVKKILLQALKDRPIEEKKCREYALSHNYRNLDHLLEWLVFESPFAALVIIDDLASELENVLVSKFQFGVEVLQLLRFENKDNEHYYLLDPFLTDVTNDARKVDTTEIDTVVVPANPDGFEETFLGEDRWYAVRIHGTMRPQIKYIAGYQTSPVSAITHIAPVKSIEPWKDTGKVVVNFSEPAREIEHIKLVKKGKVKALQNLRYTNRKRIEQAKTLDDLW